jgi:dienelactone hydrolase
MNILKHIQILILVLFPACLMGMETKTPRYFEFPKPTGEHAVGTRVFYLTDPSRPEPETKKPRQFLAQAWYPAAGLLDKPTSPYTYEMLKGLKQEMAEKYRAPELTDQLDLIRTYAVTNAPILSEGQRYPVVIFEHGTRTRRGEYSAVCEDIASHGYVVIMVMHTYLTSFTRFADGSETEVVREHGLLEFIDCINDIEFMLDSAQSGIFGDLTQICDFQNIGIVGHSYGGIMASHICRLNYRVKAGISLDGPLYGPCAMIPFHKPFMFMISPTFYETFGDEDGLAFTGITKEEFKRSLETFCQENGNSYKIILNNADHNIFSDNAILVDFFKRILGRQDLNFTTGQIDGIKATGIIRAYICSFFDKYLKGQTSQLLDGQDGRYAEDVTQLAFGGGRHDQPGMSWKSWAIQWCTYHSLPNWIIRKIFQIYRPYA